MPPVANANKEKSGRMRGVCLKARIDILGVETRHSWVGVIYTLIKSVDV